MEYYSTDGHDSKVSLREAVMRSLAPDGGVYMPCSIPLIPSALFKNMDEMSACDIAYVMCTQLFGTDIEPSLINSIVRSTLNFPIPLVDMGDNRYALELFHGPTESFKDVSARFLAQLCKYFTAQNPKDRKLNVLLASTGDTGNAVTDAFKGIDTVNVFVLYPHKGVLKERLGNPTKKSGNIIPIIVNSDFDHCRELIRQAFTDTTLNRRFALTSANSVNIGRLLPQTFYYFYAYGQLTAKLGHRISGFTVSTPCGNLGNLTAAIFARAMGLPINRFIATGTSDNGLWGEITGNTLQLSDYHAKALTSNIGRINRLMELDPSLPGKIECHTYGSDEIADTIRKRFKSDSYLMDRNTAMACRALDSVSTSAEYPGLFLATASPRKYYSKLSRILGYETEEPEHVHETSLHHLPHLTTISPTLPALAKLIEKYN